MKSISIGNLQTSSTRMLLRGLFLSTAAACGLALTATAVQAAPVTTGLVGWFDAADSATVLDSGGNPAGSPSFNGTVSTWVDKAALQGVQSGVLTAGAPGYTASSQNGQPAIHFDGNDTLTTPNMDFGHFTYFAAWRGNSGSVLVYERSPDTNGNDGDYLNASTGATVVAKRSGDFSAKDNSQGSGWGRDGVFRITEQTFGGSHATNLLYINGVAAPLVTHTDSTGNPGYNGDLSVNTVLNIGSRSGGNVGLNGDLAELLVYDHVLSAADRDQVGSYLAGKFAVSTTYVPEPCSLSFLAAGLMTLRRRRR